MLNVNGVDIEYQFDGAHDARPAEPYIARLGRVEPVRLGLDAPVATYAVSWPHATVIRSGRSCAYPVGRRTDRT